MVVGVCRIVLALPGNDSLKGKRSVVKSVLGRARQRFQVAAAEIEDLDHHRRATLGFAYLSNDAKHARSVLDTLLGFVAGMAIDAQIVDQSVRIERVGFGAGTAHVREGTLDSAGWDDVGDFEDQQNGDDEEG